MDNQPTNSRPVEQLLRIQDVAALTTLSKSCINLWVAQERFPKPSSLSATVKVWRASDINGWVDSQFGSTVESGQVQTHDTDWSLSAKGNKWRRNKGKVLVVGKREDGTYWARADSKYLRGSFNSELMAEIALDMDWDDFADVPSGGQK